MSEQRQEWLDAGKACLEAALDYLRRGWSPLCLCPPDHVGMKDHRCESPGKTPIGPWKALQEVPADEAQVRGWWRARPNANVGLCLGPVSGLVGVDVDTEKGTELLHELAGGLPAPTLTFFTGSGGVRYLYSVDPSLPLRTTHREGGGRRPLSFLAKGAQTVMPPSRHVSGTPYRWLPGRSPAQMEATPAPAWLLAQLQADGPREERREFAEGEEIPQGWRDNTLTSLAGSMRRRGFSTAAIRAALEVENQRCQPPLSEADLDRIARSIGRYKPDPMAGVSINLEGNPARAEPRSVARIADLRRAGAVVRWLWEGWIPLGVLTALAAEGGLGKTRFCADLLRRIRHGLPWPDGQPMNLPPDSRALWVVADNHHDEMVTLAEDFGIEDNLWINAWSDDPYGGVSLEEPSDLNDLDARISEVKPTLVIVDTVGNATDRNLGRQEDAKAFYFPLQVLARRHRCGFMNLTHLNATGKFLGRRVLEKVRVALRMDRPDPSDERRRLAVHKTNSKPPAALGLTMGDRGNEYDTNPPKEPEQEAGEPGQKRGRPPEQVQRAAQWLSEQLASGPKRVSYTRDAAEEAGFSVGTLYNAVRHLGVQEETLEGKKWWRLATDIPWD